MDHTFEALRFRVQNYSRISGRWVFY